MTSSIKSAGVYLRRGTYFVHPLAGSSGGDPVLFMEPVVKLEPDTDATGLGLAVMKALAASHHHAVWPTDWKHFADALFLTAGVRSHSAFNKGTRYVRVDREGSALTAFPTTSREHRGAFSPLMDRVLRCPSGDASQLGDIVLQALSASD